ncbi:MAG: hypothetical protein AAF705_22035, partial [Bacteroidota bacterium]
MEENLHKWLNQEASPDEEAQLRNQEGFDEIEAITKATEHLQMPAFDKMAAWNQLKEKHQTVAPKVVPMKPRRRSVFWLSAAAAAVAVLIVAFQFGLFDNR